MTAKALRGVAVRKRGRPKGSRNKVTLAFKEATLRVFGAVGGEKAYADWAKKNRTEYYKICARLIPLEVSGNTNGPPVVKIIQFTQVVQAPELIGASNGNHIAGEQLAPASLPAPAMELPGTRGEGSGSVLASEIGQG